MGVCTGGGGSADLAVEKSKKPIFLKKF